MRNAHHIFLFFCFKKKILRAKIFGMRKVSYIILGFLCVVYPHFAFGLDINDAIYTVNNNDVINDDININTSVRIKNYGTLNGEIHTNGYSVQIENYGEINSGFDAAHPQLIQQNITGYDNMHKINNLAGHTIEVNMPGLAVTDGINMKDFINLISGADSVNVGSGIFLVGADLPENNVPITVGNGTALYVNGIPDDISNPLVRGINQNGMLFLGQINIDPMYIVTPRIIGDALYIDVVRQTDYSMAMGDSFGEYLDELREKDPDDKLIAALDNASDATDVKRILSESLHTNPIKIMDAIRSVNTFYDTMHIDEMEFGFVARPFYIYSGDFSVVGGAGNVTHKFRDNILATIGMIGGMLKYNDNLNDYTGTLYGGNIGVQYTENDFYLRAFGAISYAEFDNVNVFDNGKMRRDVGGISGIMTGDFGLVYAVMQELKLIPFVGVRADYASVLDDSDSDFNLRAGLIATVDTNTDGNVYKFGAKLLTQTDGTIYAGIYTDMISTVDGVGGGASIGVVYDDMGMSYKLELNIKFEF